MLIKEENTRRVLELEAEFSDERIAEFFEPGNKGSRNIGVRRRPARKAVFRGMIVIFALIVFIVIFLQFFNPKISNEESMGDTIIPGDCVLLSVLANKRVAVTFGDVIIHGSRIADPEGGAYELYNRVIGVPGDMIEIRDGSVYRNGEALDEPYTKDGMTEGKMASSEVPEGCLFVLGDNRQSSFDSRDARVGFVAIDQVKGKVVFRILPVSRVGVVK